MTVCSKHHACFKIQVAQVFTACCVFILHCDEKLSSLAQTWKHCMAMHKAELLDSAQCTTSPTMVSAAAYATRALCPTPGGLASARGSSGIQAWGQCPLRHHCSSWSLEKAMFSPGPQSKCLLQVPPSLEKGFFFRSALSLAPVEYECSRWFCNKSKTFSGMSPDSPF